MVRTLPLEREHPADDDSCRRPPLKFATKGRSKPQCVCLIAAPAQICGPRGRARPPARARLATFELPTAWVDCPSTIRGPSSATSENQLEPRPPPAPSMGGWQRSAGARSPGAAEFGLVPAGAGSSAASRPGQHVGLWAMEPWSQQPPPYGTRSRGGRNAHWLRHPAIPGQLAAGSGGGLGGTWLGLGSTPRPRMGPRPSSKSGARGESREMTKSPASPSPSSAMPCVSLLPSSVDDSRSRGTRTMWAAASGPPSAPWLEVLELAPGLTTRLSPRLSMALPVSGTIAATQRGDRAASCAGSADLLTVPTAMSSV